jgi:hypothetical protein
MVLAIVAAGSGILLGCVVASVLASAGGGGSASGGRGSAAGGGESLGSRDAISFGGSLVAAAAVAVRGSGGRDRGSDGGTSRAALATGGASVTETSFRAVLLSGLGPPQAVTRRAAMPPTKRRMVLPFSLMPRSP